MRRICTFASWLCFVVLVSGCSSNQTAACDPAFDPSGCVTATQCSGAMQDCKNGGVDGCETDTGSDVLNCGGCGIACTAGPGLRPICSSGVCGASSCGSEFAECNLDATDGCETDTQRDPNHCGTCATVCPGATNAAAACAAGQCKIVCQAGYLDCDGDPSNGCEVNGAADIANCGSCKNVCPTGSAGNAACAAGSCIFTSCTAPYLTCKSGPVDSCETNTATSASNCGACGKVCPAVVNGSAACQNSNCGIGSCNANFDNCDGMLDNGCESSLNTDVNNCGACGKTCAVANATASCASATCGISSCNTGFGNCDNNPANGCEVNLNSSAAHCNACDAACPMGNICSKGMCQAPPTGQVPGVPIDTAASHTPLAPWVADVNGN